MWIYVKITRRKHRCFVLSIAVTLVLLIYYVAHKRAMYKPRWETVYDIDDWLTSSVPGCQSHFSGYGHKMVVLKYARFKGNETFEIPCEGHMPKYEFVYDDESPLASWLSRLRSYPISKKPSTDSSVRMAPTFVFKRIEAHNLYHTMCEWFNVFMISKLFNIDPHAAEIVFLDDRPPSPLDGTWDVLFGSVTKYKAVPYDTIYKTLIWSAVGYNSPLNFHNLHSVPYIEEFRKFFLRAYNVQGTRTLDCSRLHVTVIWRRDYMTHPERKNTTNGLVHRKFKNEDEIFKTLSLVFANDKVTSVILEQMSMEEQIAVVEDTDILIGMHGAGMAHAMFLPKHGAVLEFFPNYWGFLRHFKMFSKWRGVKYVGWQNTDPVNEYADFYTKIPIHVVRTKAFEVRGKIC